MRVIAYLRVSTKHQVESGQGLYVQRSICENFAKERNLIIDRFFIDAGLSGALDINRRTGLKQLLEYISKGDTLLVSCRDRLARDSDVMANIKRVIKEKKAKILSCAGEGTDSNDEYDLASVIAYGASDFIATVERTLAKTRVKKALDKKKMNNERMGHIPFGMKICEDGIHLEINHEEQEILSNMFQLRSEGYTILAACEEMNKRKLFNRGGRPWVKTSFHRIISR